MQGRGLIGVGLVAIAVIGVAVTLHSAVNAIPPLLSRPAIDCRNFTQASTCAFGIADYGGQLLGQADFCEMPHRRTERLQQAIENALIFMADSPDSIIPSDQLMNEMERRSAKRARFRVVPTDCAVIERDFLELMRELGIRPSPDDDLAPAG